MSFKYLIKQLGLLVFLLLFHIINLSGQNNDKIVLKSNEIVEGKILKVTDTSIEINPTDEKPLIIINRDEALMLIYSDNTVVNFQQQNDNNQQQSFEKQFELILERKELGTAFREYSIKQNFVLNNSNTSSNDILDEIFNSKTYNDDYAQLQILGELQYNCTFNGIFNKNWYLRIRKPMLQFIIKKDNKKYFHQFLFKKNYYANGGIFNGMPIEKFENIEIGPYTASLLIYIDSNTEDFNSLDYKLTYLATIKEK